MPRICNDYLLRVTSDPICNRVFKSEGQIMLATSAIFGLNEPNDQKRFEMVRDEIIPLLLLPENSDKLEVVISKLPEYRGCTASGAHRFMPLAIAVKNMLEERNIFSLEPLKDIPEELGVKRYMLEEHPLYSNPKGIAEKYLPRYEPFLTIKISSKGKYTWQDIGSAPKTGGSATLNIAKGILPPSFRYYGFDIAMPLNEIRDNKIFASEYIKDGMIKAQSRVNGATYFNSNIPEYNILDTRFSLSKKYDFNSICMVMDLLGLGQPLEHLPMTSLSMVDQSGKDFTARSILTMTKSQQQVIDRLLLSLEYSGILFLNLHFNYKKMPLQALINENNYDMFFIVQRMQNEKYMIYDNDPILFIPNRQLFTPSEDFTFIRACPSASSSGIKRPETLIHNGISSYIKLNRAQENALQKLFFRADLLAVRYQAWNKGVWGSVAAVIDDIRNKKPLSMLFSTYLRNVPDNLNEHDGKIKEQLIKDVYRIEKRIKNK